MCSEHIITDTKGIKRTIRLYFIKLYAHKLKNVGQMGKFIEAHTLPVFIQRNSWPESDKEIEFVVTTSHKENSRAHW